MSLVAVGIDIGSTRSKIYTLPPQPWPVDAPPSAEWVRERPFLNTPSRPVDQVLKSLAAFAPAASRVHISSVLPDVSRSLVDQLREDAIEVIYWGVERSWPVSHCYEQGRRPGDDRMLAALAARWLLPGSPAIIVDAGTAVTVDWMDEFGVLQGGAIAPGLRTLSHALASRSPQLFDVDGRRSVSYPGRSTEACLLLGVQAAFCGAVSRLVAAARSKSAAARVVLTGGDGDALQEWLPELADLYCPELLHVGFSILEHHHV